MAYQFETAEDIDDLNWLQIRIAVSDGEDEWATTNPVLQTWEVTGLIKWLRQFVAKDETAKPVWQALEPRFKVEASFGQSETKFTASLGYKFLPSALREDKNYVTRIKITFASDAASVLKFAGELEKEIQRFPVRRS